MVERYTGAKRLKTLAISITGLILIAEAPAVNHDTSKAVPRYALEAACKISSSRNKLMCGYQSEANLLAITIATECKPEDVLCAGLVYEVARNRRSTAEDKRGRVVTLGEILNTPKQFSGLDVRYKAGDTARIMDGWVDFAQSAIAGKLSGDYPPVTHYALKSVIFKTKWGKEAVSLRCDMYEFPDGHVAVGACGNGSLPFRLP